MHCHPSLVCNVRQFPLLARNWWVILAVSLLYFAATFASAQNGTYQFSYCIASNTSGSVWSVSAYGSLTLNLSSPRSVDGEWTGYPILSLSGVRLFVDYSGGLNQTSAIVGLASSGGDGTEAGQADQLLRHTFAGYSADSAGIAMQLEPAARLPSNSAATVLTLTNSEYAGDATSTMVENGWKGNGLTQFSLYNATGDGNTSQSFTPCFIAPPDLPYPTPAPTVPAVAVYYVTYCAASNTSLGAWSVSALLQLTVDNSAAQALYASGSTSAFNQVLPILSINGTRWFTDYTYGPVAANGTVIPVTTTSNVTGLVPINSSSSAQQPSISGWMINDQPGEVTYLWNALNINLDFQYTVSPPAQLPNQTESSTIELTGSLPENGFPLAPILHVDTGSSSVLAQAAPLDACTIQPTPRTLDSPTVPAVAVYYVTYCAASNTSLGAWSVSALLQLTVDNSAAQALYASGSTSAFNQVLPILSINGTRWFTDYTYGPVAANGTVIPVTTTSNVTGLVPINSSSSAQQPSISGWMINDQPGEVTYLWNALNINLDFQYTVSPPAQLPNQTESSTIELTGSLPENGFPLAPILHVDTGSSSVLAQAAPLDACTIQPTPRTLDSPTVPAVAVYYVTYCAASNTSLGAWSVSALLQLTVDNSAAQALYASGSTSAFNQVLPILSINGTRWFTDYTYGPVAANGTVIPVTTTSNVTGLVPINSSSSAQQPSISGWMINDQPGEVTYLWNALNINLDFQYTVSPPAQLPVKSLADHIALQGSAVENGWQPSGSFSVSAQIAPLLACSIAVPQTMLYVDTQTGSGVSGATITSMTSAAAAAVTSVSSSLRPLTSNSSSSGAASFTSPSSTSTPATIPSSSTSPATSASTTTSIPPPQSIIVSAQRLATFAAPIGLALDVSFNLLVADSDSTYGVTRLCSNGTQLGPAFGGSPQAAMGVAVDSANNVWVSYLAAGQMIQYSPSGQQLALINTPGNVGAVGIAVDSSDNVYVTTESMTAYKYNTHTANYSLVQSFTLPDASNTYPEGIVVDDAGCVYIADQQGESVVKFYGNGTVAAVWPMGRTTTGLALIGRSASEGLYGTYGTGDGSLVVQRLSTVDGTVLTEYYLDSFGRAYGIAVGNGMIYVAAYNDGGAVMAFPIAPQAPSSLFSSSSSTALSSSSSSSSSRPHALSSSSSAQSYPSSSSSLSSAAASVGASLGSFSYAGAFLPEWLALDGSDRLYVVDWERITITVLAALDNSTAQPGTVLRTLSAPSTYTVLGGLVLDALGNVYVLASPDPSSSDLLVLSGVNGSVLYTVAGSTLGLSFSFGIALDASNNVYITDASNNRVLVLAAIQSSTPLQLLYALNSTVSPLNYPNDVCVDAIGTIYVADTGNNRVAVLAGINTAQPGALLLSANNSVAAGRNFSDIAGLALDPTNGLVYVSDDGQNALMVLSSYYGTAAPLVQLYAFPAYQPAGLRVDGQGRSYLITGDKNITVRAPIGHTATQPVGSLSSSSSSSSSRPHALSSSSSAQSYPSSSSSLSSAAASVGASLGSFSYAGAFLPEWLALDGSDRLYVVDWERITITVLAALDNSTAQPGTVLRTLSAPSTYTVLGGLVLDALGNVYVLASPDPSSSDLLVLSGVNGSVLYTVAGSTLGLSFSFGIALDASNNVYITDASNNRVLVLAAIQSSTPLQLLYALNSTVSPLNYPNDVCVDAIGTIYVADTGNNRVAVLAGINTAQPGALLLSANNSVAAGRNFSDIAGLALDPTNGLVYVSDDGQNALMVLSSYYGTAAPLVQLYAFPAYQPAGLRVDGQGRSYLITGDKNITVRAPIGHTATQPVGSLSSSSSSSSSRPHALSSSSSAQSYPSSSSSLSSAAASVGASLGSFSYAGAFLPEWLALDGSDRLYVVDWERITITVLAALDNSTAQPGTVLRTLSAPSTYTVLGGLVLDALGNVYVLASPDPSSSDLLVLSGVNGSVLYTVAGSTLGLSFSFGIALDASNNVYITDASNNRVLVLAAIQSSTPLQLLYALNSTVSPLNYPNDVCVDAIGTIYVADTGNNRVAVLAGINTAQPGALLLSANNSVAAGRNFSDIAGLALDPTNGLVYVSDDGQNALMVLSSYYGTAAPLVQLYAFPAYQPAGLRVDGQGRSYLITGDKNITVRAPIGHTATQPVGSLSSSSTSTPTLSSTSSPSRSLSSSSWSVSALSSSSPVRDLSSTSSLPPAQSSSSGSGSNTWPGLPSSSHFLSSSSSSPSRSSSSGTSSSPSSVSTMSSCSNYAAGTIIATLVDAQQALDYASGVSVDSAGRVYVASYNDGRVVALAGLNSGAAAGNELFSTNISSSGKPFSQPADVKLDAAGNMYVADRQNNRVVILAPLDSATPGGCAVRVRHSVPPVHRRGRSGLHLRGAAAASVGVERPQQQLAGQHQLHLHLQHVDAVPSHGHCSGC